VCCVALTDLRLDAQLRDFLCLQPEALVVRQLLNETVQPTANLTEKDGGLLGPYASRMPCLNNPSRTYLRRDGRCGDGLKRSVEFLQSGVIVCKERSDLFTQTVVALHERGRGGVRWFCGRRSVGQRLQPK
jgi:hypothetical protein